jgi:hypothetical protein
MSKEEVAFLMAELLAYTKSEHGRHRALAKELGVDEGVLANWLHMHRTPSLENWLKLQAVVKKIRRRR